MPTNLRRPGAPHTAHRVSAYPIEPLFLQRWSPRAFLPRPFPLAVVYSILEAARWAPSAHNLQPWRFVFSLRGDDHWQQHLDVLHPGNASWAQNASALLFLASQIVPPAPGNTPPQPSRTHSFDAGAAWAQLALQATALGYQAHAMAGIDFDRAAVILRLPESYRLEIAVAIGVQGDATQLPPALREREHPSARHPLEELISRGVFTPSPATTDGGM